MKLSKREKILVLILIVAVIGYFGFANLPFDKLFSLDELKAEHAQKKELYELMSNNIIQKNAFEDKVQSLTEEINDLNVISDLQQEGAIVFLDNYMDKSNINASNISFVEGEAVPVSHIPISGKTEESGTLQNLMQKIDGGAEVKKDEASEADEKKLEPTLFVRQISAVLTFDSIYADMIEFIDSIQNNPIDISITNINTITEGDILQGTMTLNFYEIPKPAAFEESNEDWIWTEHAKSGKENPFSTDTTQMVFVSGDNYDFYMSLQPEVSDLPSILIGETNDVDRKTYISRDINSVENVNFAFKTENDKYYYRYSITAVAYPKNDEWEEFEPNSSGYINIVTYSKPRVLKDDSAGANISVYNDTDLKVRFDVIDDDKTSPRAYFRDARTISVTRK
jgi:type IV pilus assembly protein PilO